MSDLRQSTVQVISFGPFLDKGNGVDLETGLVAALDHAITGIMLSKNGGVLAVREQGVNFVASTYDAHGCYRVSLSAVDTGTLGRLRVIYTDPAANLPVWQDFVVLTPAEYDIRYGTGVRDVNVISQANIDFGALQKLSLNAATPAGLQGAITTLAGLLEALQGAAGPTLLELQNDAAGISALTTKILRALTNRLVINGETGAYVIYADDGITPLITGTITETGRSTPTWP